jgi:hypothetical protein
VNIEILPLVFKLGGLFNFKRRYLVLQVQLRGVSNTTEIVYAEVFRTRAEAEKAVKEANGRLRIRVGDRAIGSRKPALLVKLPFDGR